MARSADERLDMTAWLARHLVGPPQLGDVTAPVRPASAGERARDEALRTEFVRVTDPGGHTYLVERPVDPTERPAPPD
ncbi:hypothetical protein KIN34_09365 [Cellulomonas sp. DKR-3]|uniref:Uncharacterized protein n=1 Tax=Cellulomonas fulva TaxID=2835530 RepID=A0ABS5TZD1_9CELL|nr:hypothetical protein [Cellulomonas fulva]MBT0994494.1 hypothetical protein [Cellulomonas fulva]